MTTLAMVSPNLRSLSYLTYYSAGVTLSNTYARSGTYSIRIEGGSKYFTTAIPASQTVYGRVAFYNADTTSNSFRIIAYDPTSTANWTLNSNISAGLTFYRGSISGTILGSTANSILALGAWNVIEFKVYSHSSAGTVDIKLNGVSVLSLTGQNTNGSTTSTTVITIMNANGSSATYYTYVDDVVFDDANWPGLGGLYVYFPSADGSATAWSNDYTSVDECPPNDSDYISTDATTAGTRENFVFTDLPEGAADISRVGVFARAAVSDIGSGTIKPYIRQDSTNYDGSAVGLATSYMWIKQYWDTNPATSSAWTRNAVNSLEAGVVSG